MGIFDFFTKDSAEEAQRAADANRAAAQTAYTQLGNVAGTYQTGATGAINTGATSSLGALGSGLTNQLDAYNKALTGSVDAAKAGVGAYQPLVDLGANYGRAVSSYQDALGLNGPEGLARARGQFATSPGYDFLQEEAYKGAANKAASLGIAGSGNTLAALEQRSHDIANQDYSSYLDRLAGFVNPQLQATAGAASGIAGANRTLADTYAAAYAPIGAAYGTNAAQTAGIYTGQGTDLSNIYGNVAGMQSQASRDLAAGNTAANNLVYQGQSQDIANSLNFWNNLASAAGNALSPRPKAA